MQHRKTPIFMYHDIIPKNSKKNLPFDRQHYAITVDQFRFHLELITENGFKAIGVDELDRLHTDHRNVILTFDDGHISQYHYAYKILQEFDLKGNFFVVPLWINQPDFMTWEMIKEISDSGMSVQSHTYSHQFLVQLMSKQLVDEIKISRQLIERKTGKRVNFLSLPGGRFERNIWQLAGFYGYKGIFTSKPGYGSFTPLWMKIHPNQFQPLAFHRIAIATNISEKLFQSYLLKSHSSGLVRRRVSFFLGNLTRKVLGDFSYDKIWRLKEKHLRASSKEELNPAPISSYEKKV